MVNFFTWITYTKSHFIFYIRFTNFFPIFFLIFFFCIVSRLDRLFAMLHGRNENSNEKIVCLWWGCGASKIVYCRKDKDVRNIRIKVDFSDSIQSEPNDKMFKNNVYNQENLPFIYYHRRRWIFLVQILLFKTRDRKKK